MVILDILHFSTTQRAFCDSFKSFRVFFNKSFRVFFNANLMRLEFVYIPLSEIEAPFPITALALAPVPKVAVADAPVPAPAIPKLSVGADA